MKLTDYEIKRVREEICPCCNRPFRYPYDNISLLKTQYGRKKLYTFFHNECLIQLHINKEVALDG